MIVHVTSDPSAFTFLPSPSAIWPEFTTENIRDETERNESDQVPQSAGCQNIFIINHFHLLSRSLNRSFSVATHTCICCENQSMNVERSIIFASSALSLIKSYSFFGEAHNLDSDSDSEKDEINWSVRCFWTFINFSSRFRSSFYWFLIIFIAFEVIDCWCRFLRSLFLCSLWTTSDINIFNDFYQISSEAKMKSARNVNHSDSEHKKTGEERENEMNF